MTLYCAAAKARANLATAAERCDEIERLVAALLDSLVSSADVIEVHVAAQHLARREQSSSSTKEDQQLLLFEVLGRLVSGYRDALRSQGAKPHELRRAG